MNGWEHQLRARLFRKQEEGFFFFPPPKRNNSICIKLKHLRDSCIGMRVVKHVYREDYKRAFFIQAPAACLQITGQLKDKPR